MNHDNSFPVRRPEDDRCLLPITQAIVEHMGVKYMMQLDDNLVERFMWFDETNNYGEECPVNEWYEDIDDARNAMMGYVEMFITPRPLHELLDPANFDDNKEGV